MSEELTTKETLLCLGLEFQQTFMKSFEALEDELPKDIIYEEILHQLNQVYNGLEKKGDK